VCLVPANCCLPCFPVDPQYRAGLELRLHAQCANVALRPPAFRLLHDYALLRASAQAHRARGRAASHTSATPPAGTSGNAADAPFQPYALGRLPLGDPWLDDEEASAADDDAEEGAVGRRRSSLASDGVGAGGPSAGSRSVLGKLYSSTFGGGAPKSPPTPDIVFFPKPLEVDPDEVDSEAASGAEADTGAVLLPHRDSGAALASMPALSLDGGNARAKAGGAERDGEDGGGDGDDDDDGGLDAEYEFVASVALSAQSRLAEAGITLARASADLDPEWARLELTVGVWRIAGVNEQYHLCPTYPTRLPVPASVRLQLCLEHRSRGNDADGGVSHFATSCRPGAGRRAAAGGSVPVQEASAGRGMAAQRRRQRVGPLVAAQRRPRRQHVQARPGLTVQRPHHRAPPRLLTEVGGAYGWTLPEQALVDAIRLATPKSSSLIIFDARSRLAAQVCVRARAFAPLPCRGA